ncbi:MAG: chemotaxis protein CheW [Denitrovibrio sp.]|nr:MAG: chemotaxis protein CheW [Denitrovibrio sp.]
MHQNDLITYKDVQIPKQLGSIITHMTSLEDYREELRILASQWDLLTILGQISGTGTNMSGTREGFKHLTNELLSQLGLENLKKASQEISSKAQVAVDIVIRNLFERTADIGFLATDKDIRTFITKLQELELLTQDECTDLNINKTQAREKLRSGITSRFEEYTSKYSVYYDIILLDPDWNVLAQMDRNSKLTKSNDPVIKESLTTQDDYVEFYRKTDLTDREKSLVYAYRVTETNDPKSSPMGVLCLCFRFNNEMDGIFENLSSSNDWSIITLLDNEGSVIASSCHCQIPIGMKMEMVLEDKFGIVKFAGRLYLAKTCSTNGYQGFFGLGWHGHVMMPIEHAFDASGLSAKIDPEILHSVMEDPKLFSKELRNIPIQADIIQSELERTVWNGNITGNDPKSKILLWNISDAGAKTKKVFEESIGNLHETVITSVLNNVWFWAALSVDIMDRNLYERANDCRWWALTSDFRDILAQQHITPEDKQKMSEILKYINNLYTVYTNLFIYDKSGQILAVSSDMDEHLIGTHISATWIRETLALKDSQKYSVSPFEQTELYNNKHTYIYGAAISSLDSSNVLGGIGIVFDSEPEFAAMLEDSLPRDENGNIPDGCFGVFADRHKHVISSTSEDLPAGSILDLPTDIFSTPNGEGNSRIISYQGAYYAIGFQASSGYREYKMCDNYSNDVLGLVFVPLAEINENMNSGTKKRNYNIDIRSDIKGGDCIEVATFYIGNRWLGIRTEHIVEAVQPSGLTVIPGSCDFVKGQMIYNNTPTVLLDIRSILDEEECEISKETQIVITKTEKMLIGLVVDGLGAIPEIPNNRVEQPDHIIENTRYTDCIVKPQTKSENQDILVVLHPDGLLDCIKDMI